MTKKFCDKQMGRLEALNKALSLISKRSARGLYTSRAKGRKPSLRNVTSVTECGLMDILNAGDGETVVWEDYGMEVDTAAPLSITVVNIIQVNREDVYNGSLERPYRGWELNMRGYLTELALENGEFVNGILILMFNYERSVAWIDSITKMSLKRSLMTRTLWIDQRRPGLYRSLSRLMPLHTFPL
ncbi:hypothetical protein F5X98DRAFT_369584 [Xylaria grammica]|nr:hypothetical protein F5X98DRAFT_369584 [Xylaria grammica]